MTTEELKAEVERLNSELAKARELLADIVEGTGTSPGANKRYGKIRAFLSKNPACKTCNGSGIEYDGSGHTCTACNGSGTSHQSAPAAKVEHCSTCSKLNGSSYCDCERD